MTRSKLWCVLAVVYLSWFGSFAVGGPPDEVDSYYCLRCFRLLMDFTLDINEADMLKLEECLKICDKENIEPLSHLGPVPFFDFSLSTGQCAPGSRDFRVFYLPYPQPGTVSIADSRPDFFEGFPHFPRSDINDPDDFARNRLDYWIRLNWTFPDLILEDYASIRLSNFHVFGGSNWNIRIPYVRDSEAAEPSAQDYNWKVQTETGKLIEAGDPITFPPTSQDETDVALSQYFAYHPLALKRGVEAFGLEEETDESAKRTSIYSTPAGLENEAETTPQIPAETNEPVDTTATQTGTKIIKVRIEVLQRGQEIDEAGKTAKLALLDPIPPMPNVAENSREEESDFNTEDPNLEDFPLTTSFPLDFKSAWESFDRYSEYSNFSTSTYRTAGDYRPVEWTGFRVSARYTNPQDSLFTSTEEEEPSVTIDASRIVSTIIAFDLASHEFSTIQPRLFDIRNRFPYVQVRQIFTTSTQTFVNAEHSQEDTEPLREFTSSLPDVAYVENNPCIGPQESVPDDPFFQSKSSWGQEYEDQWAIQRVGYTAGEDSPWSLAGDLSPVVVAVIDTGLDWNHPDISWDNIWTNTGEVPKNGIDDDRNGYADDIIGWDFYLRNNQPWDHNGHGTFVTGIIAATQGNGKGIAGINPSAKIMVLKVLNALGHSRASYAAEAIIYAANNGARVINLSVGGYELNRTEQLAIDYARSLGVIVVAAAGNEAVDINQFQPAGLKGVLTVAASDYHDKRAVYSNFGDSVELTAPGNDVLSLRARRTDLMRDMHGVEYEPGSAYVGADKRYYRVSGTSFSAPIVAGTASLILSMNPGLSHDEVERMLTNSARDLDIPGKDRHTGYGLLDAKAALQADPKYFLIAEVDSVQAITKGGQTYVQVNGTVDADRFQSAHLEMGMGEGPEQWKKIPGEIKNPMQGGVLGLIPAADFAGSAGWTIRVVARHQSGKIQEGWFFLDLE